MIKLLSVAILAGLFFAESNQQLVSQSNSAKFMRRPIEKRCWTQWFDRDDPCGTGDWETLSGLYLSNPGKICCKPTGVEARTLSGLPAAAAGDVIHKSDTTYGFICRNKDQPNKKLCNDYRVRFSCPRSFCDKRKGGGGSGCWTRWFDRDDPSGTGDWEILSHLLKAYPGKICSKPIGVEAKTLSGVSVAAAGEVIHQYDTTSGFICRNKDQPDKKCNDYRVRFSCPRSFCDKRNGGAGSGCWTRWFDRDDPSGTGDWEILSRLLKAYPGKICSKPIGVEAKTLSGVSVAAAGEVIHQYDTTSGFICRNKDQPDKKCNDYRVRFSCPRSFCDKRNGGAGSGCWTRWFDRDDPSGTGDWEILSHLLKAYPGKICSKPIGVEAKTLSGVSVAAAGEVIHQYDTTSGFICRNKDQPDKKCNDYRVRFSCPRSFCDKRNGGAGSGCWTRWFDRDDPSGTGDWEILSHLLKAYPGKICSKPIGVEAKTLSGVSVAAAGEVIHQYDTTSGFICRNKDQPDKKCNDYRVRFRCPRSFCSKVCWTKWYDRDNPSGTGDWEALKDQRKATPNQICKKPLKFQVVTTDNLTPAKSTGQIFYINSPTKGFACRNKDQKSGICRDYKVRYGCPCKA